MRQIKIRVRRWQVVVFGCLWAVGIVVLAVRTYRSGTGAMLRVQVIRPPRLPPPVGHWRWDTSQHLERKESLMNDKK